MLLLVGAGFAAYQMLAMAGEYRAGEQTYSELQQVSLSVKEPAVSSEEKLDTQQEENGASEPAAVQESLAFPTIDFDGLKEKNPDVVGWIYIEDTNINYPVVQGEDNRHYVSTMFDGRHNKTGSIFMDFRNNPNMSDRHTILYGHNMKNKTMFADIRNYRDQAYYDAHPVGLYITPEANYRFDVVAAYVASLADSAWQLEFVAEEDAAAWIRTAIERSGFVSKAKPQDGDRFITLSTCTYEFNDARFVLVGLLRPCDDR